jgi:hypothetical protein
MPNQPIRSDAVHYGRNKDLGTWRDDRYIRCARCGFVCHLDRDNPAPKGSKLGWGMDYATTTYTTTNDKMDSKHTGYTTAENRIDPTRTGGCPSCGTYLLR